MASSSSFIASRYLRFKQKAGTITFMMRLCFAGITIGSFALMLTLIIMNGFEKTIHEKMRGITSQVVLRSPGNQLDKEAIKSFLSSTFGPSIVGMSGSSIRQVLVETKRGHAVLFLKGVEPEHEGLVSSIGEKIILPLHYHQTITSPSEQTEQSTATLPKLLDGKTILIGHKMALTNHLSVGDTITLLVPEPTGKRRISLRKEKAVVGGVFKVGLEEYDNNFAFTSLTFIEQLFGNLKGVDQISLALSDKNEEAMLPSLREQLPGITVSSWKDLYPALVSSLKLEKYVMFFILALIVLVASMNMISLLFMQIQNKRRDIAIFKAMGMSHKNITSLFLKLGMLLTISASIVGLSLAAFAGFILENYPFIQLPDVYYVSHLPARMEWHLFLIVFVCTLLLGLCATWLPIRKVRTINVTQVLRSE